MKNTFSNFTYRSGWLRGCEIPALVLFGARLIGTMNDNAISRCVSYLVLVLKSSEAGKLQKNDSFSMQNISGIFFEIIKTSLFNEWLNF